KDNADILLEFSRSDGKMEKKNDERLISRNIKFLNTAYEIVNILLNTIESIDTDPSTKLEIRTKGFQLNEIINDPLASSEFNKYKY
ncbi:726_t:CDS:1, partial [Dentiscutata erythropus]